jgi:hypothetical protein
LSCKKYEKWVNLFWDKRLNQSQEEEFKKHLAECKTCRAKLSFLESVEGRAKEIRAKEPSKEYWDNFSSRVREKIASSRVESTAYGWKKALVNVFSPWKIKVATAVVSIVLVFIIGKLFVDYHGKAIVSRKPETSVVKEAPLSITEWKKGENSFPTESPHKIATPLEQPKKALPMVSSDQEKGNAISPETESAEKQTGLKEQKVIIADKAPRQKAISIPAPVADEKPAAPIAKPQAEGTPTQINEQEMPAEAAPAAGAGGEKKIEKSKEEIISSREEKKQEATKIQDLLAPGKGIANKDITSPARTSLISAPSNKVILLHDKPIPRIKETDTLMQAVDLRGIIQRWKDQFQDHPSDSVNEEGYLQVATAYLLLNRLSPDTALVNQGSYLIEDYMNRTKDPAIKEQLSDKLGKMKSLGKK